MPRHLCPQCKSFSAKRLAAIIWHIRRDHRYESLSLKCGISGCPKSYKNAASFRTHLQRYHPQMLSEQPEDGTISTGFNRNDEISDRMNNEEQPESLQPESPITFLHDEGTVAKTTEDEQMRSAALFILKAREVMKLPQDTVDSLIQDTKDLFGMIIQQHNETTRKLIERAQISLSTIPGIVSHLECSQNPFQGLETEYLQTKYFCSELGLVVSTLAICTVPQLHAFP